MINSIYRLWNTLHAPKSFFVPYIRPLSSCESTSSCWIPTSLPNPMNCPELAGRRGVNKSCICDPNMILSEETKNVIEGYINAYESQMAVVVINKMNDDFVASCGGDNESAARAFAIDLHNTWGVGNRQTNDGILFFISVQDRVIFVSTGDGINQRITHKVIQGIILDMKYHLKRKDYDTALEQAVVGIIDVASGKLSPQVYIKKAEREAAIDTIIMSVFAGLAVLWLIHQGYEHYQQKKFQRLFDEAYNALDEVFATDDISCPRCLHRYSPSKGGGRVTLACHHSFCHACMKEQMDFNEICCICEQPLIVVDGQSSDIRQASPQETPPSTSQSNRESERTTPTPSTGSSPSTSSVEDKTQQFRVERYYHYYSEYAPSELLQCIIDFKNKSRREGQDAVRKARVEYSRKVVEEVRYLGPFDVLCIFTLLWDLVP